MHRAILAACASGALGLGCGDAGSFVTAPLDGGADVDEGGSPLAGSGGGSATGSGGTGGSSVGTGGAPASGAGGSGGVGGGGGAEAGSGGGGSANMDGGMNGSVTCADVSCADPASCDDSSGSAVCVCPSGYDDTNGDGSACDDVDECAADTHDCDSNATCENTEGGFDCTCDDGYEGDGTSCSDIDECASDPCGTGSCTQNAPGQGFTCSCGAGQLLVDDTCVCDLGGVFGMRVTTDVSWSNVENVEDGEETTFAWALRTHTYDTDGTLTMATRPCGGTSPDICSVRIPFVKPDPEAHAQFFPDGIWDRPSMPVQVQTVSLPGVLPGSPFVLPDAASLLGISLTDPMGAWPASRSDVGGGGATNGARWEDHDARGGAGVLSHAVDPGTDSPVCPRGNPTAAWPYAYWPGLDGVTLRRVARFRVASRVISGLDGSITSCDRIDGDVTGPDNGMMQSDARVHSCRRVEGGGLAECEPDLIDFFDGQDQVQQIDAATFTIVRLPNAATCADARAADYD